MSDLRQADGSVDLLAATLVAAGGMAMLASLVAWSAGQLCLVLTGAGWQRAPFDDSPGFLVRLLVRRDAQRAWANAYPRADAVAQPWLFWLLVALISCAVAVASAWVVVRFSTPDRRQRVDPARWATRRQERRIAVPSDADQRRWRLVAGRGRASRRLLAGDDCVSAVVFGPTGRARRPA